MIDAKTAAAEPLPLDPRTEADLFGGFVRHLNQLASHRAFAAEFLAALPQAADEGRLLEALQAGAARRCHDLGPAELGALDVMLRHVAAEASARHAGLAEAARMERDRKALAAERARANAEVKAKAAEDEKFNGRLSEDREFFDWLKRRGPAA